MTDNEANEIQVFYYVYGDRNSSSSRLRYAGPFTDRAEAERAAVEMVARGARKVEIEEEQV